MTFEKLVYKILQEKYFSYTVSNNVRIRIYDFYVLSYLHFLVTKTPVKNYRDEDLELKASVLDAYKIICSTLRKTLLYDVVSAITEEISNVIRPYDDHYESVSEEENLPHPAMLRSLDSSKDMYIYTVLVNELQGFEYFDQFDRIKLWQAVHNILHAHNISIPRYVEACKNIFNFEYFDWHDMFAGEAWQSICDGWLRLYHSTPHTPEEQVAIDHIFDLEHNNGSILNKNDEYATNDSGEWSDWLSWVLDHKRDAESMYELIPHASGAVSSMAQRVLKERLGTTLASSGVQGFRNFYSNKERDENVLTQKIQRYIKNGSKGTLNLVNTPIRKLPDNLTVNGDLYLSHSSLSSIPNNLTVTGRLILLDTPISKQYTKEQLAVMLPNVSSIDNF